DGVHRSLRSTGPCGGCRAFRGCHRVAAGLAHRFGWYRTIRTPHSLSFGLVLSRPEPRAPFSSPLFHSYIVTRSWPAINGLGSDCRNRAKSMLNDVYNRRILELAGTIPRI